ncbi:hypothetical protein GXM_08898 [Nostoc sphaeroides CCNUC1]|uniref:Uncharacterized protein n=1 Tax=Nostoc sphaeroides CCNUC1 TaxID=2653204 RepID=A0A5P8WFF2_9NOSO|nr:hypothetical protein GXM_08898 [Nostoc sphaeroides CCNUC1]
MLLEEFDAEYVGVLVGNEAVVFVEFISLCFDAEVVDSVENGELETSVIFSKIIAKSNVVLPLIAEI